MYLYQSIYIGILGIVWMEFQAPRRLGKWLGRIAVVFDKTRHCWLCMSNFPFVLMLAAKLFWYGIPFQVKGYVYLNVIFSDIWQVRPICTFRYIHFMKSKQYRLIWQKRFFFGIYRGEYDPLFTVFWLNAIKYIMVGKKLISKYLLAKYGQSVCIRVL